MANRARMKPERRAAYDAKNHWSASSLDALALLPIAAATIPDAGKSRRTPKVCDPPDPELVAAVQRVQSLQRQLLDAIETLVRGALDKQDEHVLRAPTVAGALRLHRLTLAIHVARRAYEDAKRGTALFS